MQSSASSIAPSSHKQSPSTIRTKSMPNPAKVESQFAIGKSRVSEKFGTLIRRPPSPPIRRSSQANKTLNTYSKSQAVTKLNSQSSDSVSKKGRVCCHMRDPEKAKNVRIIRTISYIPIDSQKKDSTMASVGLKKTSGASLPQKSLVKTGSSVSNAVRSRACHQICSSKSENASKHANGSKSVVKLSSRFGDPRSVDSKEKLSFQSQSESSRRDNLKMPLSSKVLMPSYKKISQSDASACVDFRRVLQKPQEKPAKPISIIKTPASSVKFNSNTYPLTSARKTTFVEDAKRKISKPSRYLSGSEILRSTGSSSVENIKDAYKRKQSMEKNGKSAESAHAKSHSNKKKIETSKTQNTKSEALKSRRCINGGRNDVEKRAIKKIPQTDPTGKGAKKLIKAPSKHSGQPLEDWHRGISRSDTFFQNLFLRNISPLASRSNSLKTSLVCEYAKKHEESGKGISTLKPCFKSLGVYLSQKQPVSRSKFRSLERDSEFPTTPQTERKFVLRDFSGSDGLLDTKEFGSESVRGRRMTRTRDFLKERCLSEPASMKPQEMKSQLFPCLSSPSRIKSVTGRRVRALKQQLKEESSGSTALRRLRTRSAGAVEELQRKNIVFGSNLSLTKDGSRAEYQQYILELLHYKRKSPKFSDLYGFYASLERVGELEKRTSSDDLRPKGRKEEVIDYDRWKQIRLREKYEQELNKLYEKLRTFQKEKDFIYSTKDVEKLRWHGDCRLRCKQRSVENLLQYFKQLKNGETELLSSKMRENDAKKDVYKPLWRGCSVVKTADVLQKRASCKDDNKNVTQYSSTQRILGGSKQFWSSLSIQQIATLKKQLNEIYSVKNCKSELTSSIDQKAIEPPPRKNLKSNSDKTENKNILASYEVTVPPQSEFGDDLTEDRSGLHVRCHSVTTSDRLASEKGWKSFPGPESPLKRSGSICRGRSINESDYSKSHVFLPLTAEEEKQRLSLSLGKEILDEIKQRRSSLPSPLQASDTDGHTDITGLPDPWDERSMETTSPQTTCSMDVSYDDNASKTNDKQLLAEFKSTDEYQTKNAIKKKPSLSPAKSSEAILCDAPCEIGSITGSSELSTATSQRKVGQEYVPKQVEFFESIDKKTQDEELGNPVKKKVGKLACSRSFADLKELFGETQLAKHNAFSFLEYRSLVPAEPSLRMRKSSDKAADEDRRSVYSWLKNQKYNKSYSVVSARASLRNAFAACENLWLRTSVSHPERSWRDYLKTVQNGTVKRLSVSFESRAKSNETPYRYRSDPELARNYLKKTDDARNRSKLHRFSNCGWLPKKYELRKYERIKPITFEVPRAGETQARVKKLLDESDRRAPISETSRPSYVTTYPVFHVSKLESDDPYPLRYDGARSLSFSGIDTHRCFDSALTSPSISETSLDGRIDAVHTALLTTERTTNTVSILKQSQASAPFDPIARRPSRCRRELPAAPPLADLRTESSDWWPPVSTFVARPTVTFQGLGYFNN